MEECPLGCVTVVDSVLVDDLESTDGCASYRIIMETIDYFSP